MQTTPAALDIIDGEIVRTGKAGPSMRLDALAAATGGLRAEAEFTSTHMVYPYGAHVVQLKLDPDTGGVAIERYLVAFDIGKQVNPMLVQGQITGGMAQGLGGALYEEFLYSEDGEPLSVTFADYLLPTAREVPNIEVIVTEDAPSPLNTLRFQGRRRRRHHAGRRGDRVSHRRCAAAPRRGDAIAGHAAAAQNAFERPRGVAARYALRDRRRRRRSAAGRRGYRPAPPA